MEPNTIASNNPDSALAKRYNAKTGQIDTADLAPGQYFGRSGEILGGSPAASVPTIPTAGQSNAVVLGPNAAVPNRPVYDTSTTGSATSPYYSRQTSVTDPFADTEKNLVTAASSVGVAPDQATILEQKRKNAQDLVDSIKAEFNNVIADEQKAGDIRASRVRASNVASGISGSDFASANAMNDSDATTKIIEARQKEMSAKIQAVLSNVDQSASEEYAKERDSYLARAEQGINTITAYKDRQKTTATNNIKALAASGTSFDDFKTNYPDQYQKLLDQGGYSEADAKALFIAGKPKQDQVFSEKVGSTQVIGYRDPITNKITTEKIDLPESYDSFEVTSDGTPLFINKSTGEAKIATGFSEGQFTKPVDPVDAQYKALRNQKLIKDINSTTTGGGRYTAAQLKELQQAGIDKAEQSVKDFYLNTPPTFRDEFIRNNATSTAPRSLDTVVQQYQSYEAKSKKKGVDSLL